jgi:hypothetical protein
MPNHYIGKLMLNGTRSVNVRNIFLFLFRIFFYEHNWIW